MQEAAKCSARQPLSVISWSIALLGALGTLGDNAFPDFTRFLVLAYLGNGGANSPRAGWPRSPENPGQHWAGTLMAGGRGGWHRPSSAGLARINRGLARAAMPEPQQQGG
jgi:hypothetical protein